MKSDDELIIAMLGEAYGYAQDVFGRATDEEIRAMRAVLSVVRANDGDAEREKVADWMTAHSYATGAGDSIGDLLGELSWQIREERERALAVCDEINALSVELAAVRAEHEQTREHWRKEYALKRLAERACEETEARAEKAEAEAARLRKALSLIAIVEQGCGGNLTFKEMAESAMSQARAALQEGGR